MRVQVRPQAGGGRAGRQVTDTEAQAVKNVVSIWLLTPHATSPAGLAWRAGTCETDNSRQHYLYQEKRPSVLVSYALTLTRGMIDREKHRQPLRRTAQPATSPSTPHPSAPLAHSLPLCKVRKSLVAPAEAAGRPAKSSRQVAGVGPLPPPSSPLPPGWMRDTPARGMLRLAGVGGERPDVGRICGWGWSRRSADGNGSGDAAWWRGRAFPGWGVCASQLTRALEACPPR